MIFTLIVLFSISAISASDANSTDLVTSNINDETELSLDDDLSNQEVSKLDNTNTLSTNIESNPAVESSSNKNSTELTNASKSIYYKGSYQVTLKDTSSNKAIANKKVNFVINGVSYNSTTDSNGIASVDLTLNPGNYSAIVSFAGDETYSEAKNLSSTIEILSTIESKDITKYYKGSTKYTATFYTTEGNVLANTTVQITVNGKTYTQKTDSNGAVSLAIDLKPGSYKVEATDPITGYKLNTTFKILSTVTASDVSKIYKDSKKFTAKFLKSNGKALAKTKIKFKLNGKTYKVKTNSKGVAKLSLKNLKKGTYKIISYNKDGLTKTNKIKVYKKAPSSLTTSYYTFYKSDKKTIKVKLSNGLGETPKGKTINIKINGKSYNKKTNSKGVASLKLPSLKTGVYTVKYKFAGNSLYKAASAENRVAVISTNDTTLTVKGTTTFGEGAGTPLEVAVTAGGVALEKRTVNFKIDNETYAKTTDKNGIASLPIKLGIGNYTVSYTVENDTMINSQSGSVAITVKERTASSLIWKSASTFKKGSQTYKVLLVDGNNKPISGQTVKLTVNSKTYTATTSSNGYAKFKITLSRGTYKVKVKFAGSNDYLSSSIKKSVTVNVASVKGINQVNTISDLSAYLKSSKNCQVGNSKIKALVDSLTKGLTSETKKATVIFNYVRDYIAYSFYYDTKYGATGTLAAKKGNCVDHSHLLVAMFRTAGLAARYVHGSCTFTSGNSYGHVWTQVLIGNTWTVADATSSRNSLGKIANWNTKTFSYSGSYSSLSF